MHSLKLMIVETICLFFRLTGRRFQFYQTPTPSARVKLLKSFLVPNPPPKTRRAHPRERNINQFMSARFFMAGMTHLLENFILSNNCHRTPLPFLRAISLIYMYMRLLGILISGGWRVIMYGVSRIFAGICILIFTRGNCDERWKREGSNYEGFEYIVFPYK